MRPALYRRGETTSITVEGQEAFYASLPWDFKLGEPGTLWGCLWDAGLSGDTRFAVIAAVKRQCGE